MIMVKVRYFNLLALHAGTRHQSIELPDEATLADFILKVAKSNSPAFREIVLQNEVPSQHLRIFHNGAPVFENDLNLHLADGDEIMLFPAVAGGAVETGSMQETGASSQRFLLVGGAVR